MKTSHVNVIVREIVLTANSQDFPTWYQGYGQGKRLFEEGQFEANKSNETKIIASILTTPKMKE